MPANSFQAVNKPNQSTSSVRDDMLDKVGNFSGLDWCNELESIFGCTDAKMSTQSYNAATEKLKSTATSLDDLDAMQEVVKAAKDKLFIRNDGKVASEDEAKVGASSTPQSDEGCIVASGNDTTCKSTKSDTTTKNFDGALSDGGGKYILLFEFCAYDMSPLLCVT